MQLHQPGPVIKGPLRPSDLTKPEPGPGQIRLKVHVCGVCHTDLHTVEGDLALPKLPVTPGHQVVGVVDKLGLGTAKHAVGNRVGVAWLNQSCGACDACLAYNENLCQEARFTGLHVDGGYAEYLVVDQDFAFQIPALFDDASASPLLCAGIVGYRALRLSGIRPGQSLGLYGFGASAHLVIQVARFWDCRVYVFTRGEQHRQLAREMGAEWAGGAEENCPVPLNAGIIFAPAGWIVPLALKHLAPGGTLAINAIHMSPIPEMPYKLIYGERVVRSVANFTRQDATEFLELAANIPVQAEVEQFDLSEANLVLQRLKASQIKASAVLRISQATN